MLISAAIASDIGKKEKNSKAISTVAGLIDGIGSLLTAISMLIIPKFKGDLFILFSIEVLPDRSITTACEAGVTSSWYKYAAKVLGVDSFGESAPAPQVFEAKGLTVDGLVAMAKK